MEPTYRVAELSAVVARAVARALPDDVWVEGEIRDLSRSRNGHVYFTLVDPDGDGDPPAVMPVTLFSSDRRAVNRVLVRNGAMRMTDGVHVRIRGRVAHYAPRGTVQLRMTWIDTDYTMGRLAAARRALLGRLRAAGLVDRNADLPVPILPLRIGLVTSVGSAAHADFLSELEASGYGFEVVTADARVQGADGPASLTAALSAIVRCGVDVAAIVRGGGAQTDLAAFDSEPVARAVATAEVPVFVGIGHEVDSTVVDRVASRSLKTPTACAQEIVMLVRAYADRLDALAGALGRLAPEGLIRTGRRLDKVQERLAAAARLHVSRHRGSADRMSVALTRNVRRSLGTQERRVEGTAGRIAVTPRTVLRGEEQRLGRAVARLGRGGTQALQRAEARVEGFDALQRAQAPERMLARGWSLTYGEHGRLVRAPHEAAPGDRLRTVTAGGDIASVVAAQDEGEATGE